MFRQYKEKSCVNCETQFGPKRNINCSTLAWSAFDRAKCCSKRCVIEYAARLKREQARPYEEKVCAVCGSKFGPSVRTDQTTGYNWAVFDKKLTCGLSCMRIARRASNVEKICRVCGSKFAPERKENGSYDWGKFLSRRTCRLCQKNKVNVCHFAKAIGLNRKTVERRLKKAGLL